MANDPIDLVLIHAFPLDARMWAPQVSTFVSAVKVHALDLPGFGTRAAQPAATTMSGMADAVFGSLKTLGEKKFVAVGLSMGGYVLMELIKQRGLPTGLQGIILADTRPDADSEEGRARREKMAERARHEGTRAVADVLMPLMFTPGAQADVVASTRAMMESQPKESIAAASLAMSGRTDSLDVLKTLSVPTLVICGELDTITPPSTMRAMADAMRNARFELIANASHLSNLEQPAAFNDAVSKFLGTLS